MKFDGQGHVVDLGEVADFERGDAFTLGCRVWAEGQGSVVIAKMDEDNAHRGFDLGIVGGKVWVHLIHKWPENADLPAFVVLLSGTPKLLA